MQYYFAPMEGITGYLYRQAHQRYFQGPDKYFMPFLSPSQNYTIPRRELRDIMAEHNVGIPAVPQLLTKRAEDFLWTADKLADLGYEEVNLNLGCPSGTVAAKGKGAGFLAHRELLEEFLTQVFTRAKVKISIKTRLGVHQPEEFAALIELYNGYPVTELIIHPRVQKDFYRHPVRMEAFAQALAISKNPVCYNGDLVTAAECGAFAARFPTVERVMIGRGLLANPALLEQLGGGAGADRARLEEFHDSLYEGYCAAFGSRRNAMLRMKELWFYLICLFEGGEGHAKVLRKATEPGVYEGQVRRVFRELELRGDAEPRWR